MSRRARTGWMALALALSGAGLSAQSTGPVPDSLYVRAQRLVNDGAAPAGRALVDSLVQATADGTDAHAEALYWRATLAADAGITQHDYITIVVDYALSPRAPDALLKLGQLEVERGDRDAARRHLERLLLDYANAPAAAEGWFWLGRARLLNADLPGGCMAFDSARARLAASDVERRNQVNYYAQPCRTLVVAPAAKPITKPVTKVAEKDSMRPAKDTAPVTEKKTSKETGKDTSKDTRKDSAPSTAPRYSAQVAAYKLRSDAEALARKLKDRGLDARVASLTLYHVRIGVYAKRADAVALVARLKQQHIDAFVVEAEPREP